MSACPLNIVNQIQRLKLADAQGTRGTRPSPKTQTVQVQISPLSSTFLSVYPRKKEEKKH